MAFIYKGTWLPNSGRLIIGGSDMALDGKNCTLITNSGVVKVGDVIATTTAASGNGIVVRRYNATGDSILGVLTSVENPATGGQATPDSGTTDTWTVTATNETAAKLFAKIDISPWSVYSGPLDATIHTTQKAGWGTFFDPATGSSAGTISESSATRTVAQGRGLACHGVDADDTTRALVSICESVLLTGL